MRVRRMRELKFRAFIEPLGRYASGIDTIQFHKCCDVEGAGIWTVVTANEGIFEFDDIIVEQYTGLKDKNGKEIYEGDIVRIDSMDEIRVGYVELVADQYCIVCGEDEEGNKIVAEFYYYSKPEENCKVIGNIHENPELLGD